ncbi:hypothetical protein HYPBUDRAFT_126897 [Hyphopichia burtonii NRRL Y-1933]|uniref:GPI anchored protein n=1 Tax=Hyphopichia burtonii NRRL Y-1933 TaxID=984485 RepID=A0A1E4RF24_9ASCO|nr:hypothetical protein HYPBUDRAFT_126897 [Hyphopichia burtonii NRRL Y-1933]ODV65869.1 hypothetical protein HYPBUDRAFT_126897 [Hyphopichia burtonii NRRL Y-1933]
MQYKFLSTALIASSVAFAATNTVTQDHTTLATLTSCTHDTAESATTPSSQTVVTTTVNGVETAYTTVSPASSAPAPAAPASSAPAAPAPSQAAASSPAGESDSYVDVTTTPVETASTGVEATETSQDTLYSTAPQGSESTSAGNSSLAPQASTYEAAANGQNVMVGFAGLAGIAAVLL